MNSASRCSFVPALLSDRGLCTPAAPRVMLPAPPKRLSGTQSGMMLSAGTRPVVGSGEPHTMDPSHPGPDGPQGDISRTEDEASLDSGRLGRGVKERRVPSPASDAAFEPDQRAPQIDLLLVPAVAGLDQAAPTSGTSTPKGL